MLTTNKETATTASVLNFGVCCIDSILTDVPWHANLSYNQQLYLQSKYLCGSAFARQPEVRNHFNFQLRLYYMTIIYYMTSVNLQ